MTRTLTVLRLQSPPIRHKDIWNVGSLLQSEEALSVLDDEWRPWPKVKEDTAESQKFYEVHDRNKKVPDLS
jgi:hypothetical protein